MLKGASPFFIKSFAGAFGGLLASAISKMEGIRGYHAWRWVFVLEGILTCVLSIAALFLVADFLEHAKWLTDDGRAFVVGRLAADEGSSGFEERITWQGVLEIFKTILSSKPSFPLPSDLRISQ